MLRKLLDGLFFGAGFGVALFVVWIVGMYYVLPAVMESRFGSGPMGGDEHVVESVPDFDETRGFLGSTGIYSGDFTDDRSGVLAGGPGRIVGSAQANGQPVAGLKLRLALNDSVLSQWAETGADGRYTVDVPLGKYAISGFELDKDSADEVLAGTINHPQTGHFSGAFVVTENEAGRGIDLVFVDPVVKKPHKRTYSAEEAVVLEWEPYPDAFEYSVQLSEKSEPRSWKDEALFPWHAMPVLREPRIDLKAQGVQLKPGRFYVLQVYARDRLDRTLSETARMHADYDFEVVE